MLDNPLAVWAALERTRPDLVYCDVDIPGARRHRARPDHPRRPALGRSGAGALPDRRTGRRRWSRCSPPARTTTSPSPSSGWSCRQGCATGSSAPAPATSSGGGRPADRPAPTGPCSRPSSEALRPPRGACASRARSPLSRDRRPRPSSTPPRRAPPGDVVLARRARGSSSRSAGPTWAPAGRAEAGRGDARARRPRRGGRIGGDTSSGSGATPSRRATVTVSAGVAEHPRTARRRPCQRLDQAAAAPADGGNRVLETGGGRGAGGRAAGRRGRTAPRRSVPACDSTWWSSRTTRCSPSCSCHALRDARLPRAGASATARRRPRSSPARHRRCAPASSCSTGPARAATASTVLRALGGRRGARAHAGHHADRARRRARGARARSSWAPSTTSPSRSACRCSCSASAARWTR